MSMDVSCLQVGGGPRVNLPDDVRFDGEDHEKVAASQGRCKEDILQKPFNLISVYRN